MATNIGENIGVEVKGSVLTLTVDVSKASLAPSKSGKTRCVASSHGNQAVAVDGKTVVVGLNVYTR